MTHPIRIGRRHFLAGAAGFTLAIPFLSSLEATANAAGAVCDDIWDRSRAAPLSLFEHDENAAMPTVAVAAAARTPARFIFCRLRWYRFTMPPTSCQGSNSLGSPSDGRR